MVAQQTGEVGTTEAPRDNALEENAILAVIDAVASAARDGDIDALMSHYTESCVCFDMMPPLMLEGIEEYRKNWEKGLEMMPGGWVWEPANIKVKVDGKIGFASMLVRCGGTDDKGNTMIGWVRVTYGFKKEDGVWKIAHEHDSVPIDMNENKPLFELQPDDA